MEPNTESHFSSKNLSMRAQKKLLGKMAARNVAKHFINDSAACLLDNLYRILKDFYNKRDAEKVVKNIIKMSIKIGILHRNGKFSAEDQRSLELFQKKFHQLILTIVSFQQVAFSYDRMFLKNLLDQTEAFLEPPVRSHLTEKSANRVEMIFNFVGNAEFLDAVFKNGGKYCDLLQRSADDLNRLLEGEEL